MPNTPPDRDADGNLSCPDCFGPVWDNRKKKADGTFTRKSPDFACKDKDDCGWAYWLDRGSSGGGGRKRKKKRKKKASGGSGKSLAGEMYIAYQAARQIIHRLVEEDEVEMMEEQIIAPEMAYRIFSAHAETGRPIVAPKKKRKKKKPPPPPEPEPEEEEYEYVPDSSLPF